MTILLPNEDEITQAIIDLLRTQIPIDVPALPATSDGSTRIGDGKAPYPRDTILQPVDYPYAYVTSIASGEVAIKSWHAQDTQRFIFQITSVSGERDSAQQLANAIKQILIGRTVPADPATDPSWWDHKIEGPTTRVTHREQNSGSGTHPVEGDLWNTVHRYDMQCTRK